MSLLYRLRRSVALFICPEMGVEARLKAARVSVAPLKVPGPTLLDYEVDLRVRTYTHCGPAEFMEKIRPQGVAIALRGEDRFAEEMDLTAEERAARVQLIPGHNLEVYLACLAAYGGQAA